MNPFESLIKFLPELKSVNLTVLSNIHLGVNIHSGKKVEVINKTVVIDLNKLTLQERARVLQQLPVAVKNNIPVLEDTFKAQAVNYLEEISQPDNQELIAYFVDKLPLSDLPILKASLYLRSQLIEHKDTQQVKKDIITRYGKRGSNISNLCSAGYFESWIKPLYEGMAKSPNFEMERFRKIYNEVIENLPFTIFVNRSMNEKEIEASVREKLELMTKYGIRTLNIHGIGKRNIEIIKQVIQKAPKEFEKHIEQENNVTVVKLSRNNL
jgi:hypothetical protein